MQSITYLFILRGITNNKHRISTKKTVSVPYFKQPDGAGMVQDGEIPSIAFSSWLYPAAWVLQRWSGFAERQGSLWCISSCSISEQRRFLPAKGFFLRRASRDRVLLHAGASGTAML